MISMTVEKSYGTAAAKVRVRAASIERALRLAGEDARVVFPIDAKLFFAAQGTQDGGDIGGMVTNRLGVEFPQRLVGIHVTFVAEPYVSPGAPEPSARLRASIRASSRSTRMLRSSES